MPSWLDPYTIITATGPWALWAVALIVFLECGLWPILPGDSLLFAVGMLCAMGLKGEDQAIISYFGSKPLTLLFVCAVLFLFAWAGNLCGYYVGKALGPTLFKPREGFMGKVFDPKHVQETHEFFEKYGAMSLILGRFTPFIRTFVTMIAGIGGMNFKKFATFSGLGAAIWVAVVTVTGFFLGRVSFVRDHIETVFIAIIVVSVIPAVIGALKSRKKAA